MGDFIPVSKVAVPAEVHQLVEEVLRSGMLAAGPRVAEFESAFAELCGVRHALAVNNGTTALVVALESLNLRPGDEVITSAFTFAATLNAILEAGATARFADIGIDFNADPDSVAERISERTKVLMPVHLYGQPAAMPDLMTLAQRHDLRVVEDAAQAHGAAIGEQRVGSFGIGCFSLYGTKNLTTGEGGMVTTNDDEVADRIAVLRNQGMRARYEYVVPGHNYRMTDLAAAVGIPQLARIEEINAARQRHAAALQEGLAGVEGLSLPVTHPDRTHVWHQFTVRVDSASPVTRDELVERLHGLGVGSGVYYPKVVFDYDCYRTHPNVVIEDCPAAARAAAEVVSLPVHPGLSDADVDCVIESVRKVMGC